MTKLIANIKSKEKSLKDRLTINNMLLLSFITMSLVLILYVQLVSSRENDNINASIENSEASLVSEDSIFGVSTSEEKSVINNGSKNSSAKSVNSESTISVKLDNKSENNQPSNEARVNISINSNSVRDSDFETDDLENDNSNIQVNNNVVTIPENGRVRETIKDEDSTTRIRADIDNDGNSSIKISTKSE